MISILKKLLRSKSIAFNTLMNDGALIIDVRTPNEFNSGNIKGSSNIPLNEVQSNIKRIQKLKKPVIFCCASGVRSAQATSIAKARGVDAYNGGGWSSLNRELINNK